MLDVLLQMMEEGRLTDGQGRVCLLAETVIILTSNLGAESWRPPSWTDSDPWSGHAAGQAVLPA